MYLDFFGLAKRPFALAPDPGLMVWTEQYKAALQVLQTNALRAGSVTLLAGEIGCGKTTLLQALIQNPEIAARLETTLISVRLQSEQELVDHLTAGARGLSSKHAPGDAASIILDSLDKRRADGLAPLIIVDEAHTMATGVAVLLARLAASGPDNPHPPAIILAGHPELMTMVKRPEAAALRAAVDRQITLRPLAREEVASFVRGRLQAAGLAGEGPFDEGAIAAIYRYSGGTPRLINKACDLCLFCAAKQDRRTIDNGFVTDVLTQLAPPGGNLARLSQSAAALDPSKDIWFDLPPRASSGTDPVQPSPQSEPRPEQIAQTAPLEMAEPRAPAVAHLQAIAPIADPAPARPRTRRWAAVAVAACAVPVALFLAPEIERRTDAAEETHTPSVQASVANDAVLGQPAAETTDLAAIRTEVASAQQTLKTLNATILSLEAESETLNAALARTRAERDQVESDLHTAVASLEATRAELQAARVAHDDLRDLIATREGRLEAITKDIAAAEAQLLGLKDMIKAERVTGTAALPQSSGRPPASGAPAPPELVPLGTVGEDPSMYFTTALRTADAEQSAINYARAAVRGHPRAALYLGQLFETGDGLLRTPEIAQRWYKVAEDEASMHDAALAASDIAPDLQEAAPLAAVGSEGTADFVWQGRAREFTLELAGADRAPIAFARTPLTAMRVAIPGNALYWRVTTDAGASFEWQPITPAAD